MERVGTAHTPWRSIHVLNSIAPMLMAVDQSGARHWHTDSNHQQTAQDVFESEQQQCAPHHDRRQTRYAPCQDEQGVGAQLSLERHPCAEHAKPATGTARRRWSASKKPGAAGHPPCHVHAWVQLPFSASIFEWRFGPSTCHGGSLHPSLVPQMSLVSNCKPTVSATGLL